MLALIVQWLGHLVVAEKTRVRFSLGASNNLFLLSFIVYNTGYYKLGCGILGMATWPSGLRR
jgi:hypothetical protein